jgi:hypothetical protein
MTWNEFLYAGADAAWRILDYLDAADLITFSQLSHMSREIYRAWAAHDRTKFDQLYGMYVNF